jgi:ABC-type uncharacterized transport system permease subunit
MSILWLLFSVEFVKAAIRAATPLIGAAVGEVAAERSGFVNIGVEGMMLGGAFAGVVGSWWLHSVWGGVLLAVCTGGVVGWLLAVISVYLGVNQVVAGTALNLAAAGLTTFLNRAIFGASPPAVASFATVPVYGLHRLPLVGAVFFDQIPLVYLIYLLVPVAGALLSRTGWGLRLRAVGENPAAAASAGIRVRRTRTFALIVCGMLAALGGTYYSLGNVQFFTDNMTAGNGFIALAVVIVARWNPFWVAPAALVFGGASALALRAQAFHAPIPYEFLFMLPYVLTLLIYGGVVRRGGMPAALGTDYKVA